MAKKPVPTFICNNCGEEVRFTARSCPHCGADDETAWKEGAGRPIILTREDDDFDYDDFVQRELHGKKPKNTRWWIPVLAAILAGIFILALLKGML